MAGKAAFRTKTSMIHRSMLMALPPISFDGAFLKFVARLQASDICLRTASQMNVV